MTDETRDPATRIATDGLCRLFADARREGIDDAETAVAAVNAAAAVYQDIHGPAAAPFANEMRKALVRAEALRIAEIDARIFGEPLGRA